MRSLSLLLAAFSLLAVAGCRGRTGSTAACTPGEVVDIGCTSTLGTVCSGDPTLTICDASVTSDPESCSRSGTNLGYDDDGGGGRCPYVTVTCPASGSITINPNPFGSSISWSCSYALNRHGGGGPTSSVETCMPGEGLVVGCDSTVGSLCSGDPTITVCDANVTTGEACINSASGRLGYDDDGGDGSCPRLTTSCPASGRVAVNANPFSSGASFTCNYGVNHGGVGP